MKKFIRWFYYTYFGKDDPVKHCKYYRDMGCAHVDGIACDMKTCKERIDYEKFL